MLNHLVETVANTPPAISGKNSRKTRQYYLMGKCYHGARTILTRFNYSPAVIAGKEETVMDKCEQILQNAVIHTLANGATVMSLSPHEFRFSDGTVAPPQHPDVVALFTLARDFREVRRIKGMAVVEMAMRLTIDGQVGLGYAANMVDIVIVPFPVLTALREQGIRNSYPNCVAFNATQETQRSSPTEKVVDIEKWSY